jgi:hypothetical protein
VQVEEKEIEEQGEGGIEDPEGSRCKVRDGVEVSEKFIALPLPCGLTARCTSPE